MQQKKFRTVLRSAASAVILVPALAFAQSNSSSPSGQGTQGGTARGSQSSGSPEATQGSSAQGSSAQGTQGSSAGQGSQGSSPQGSSPQGSSPQGSSPQGSSASGASGSSSASGDSMAGSQATGMQGRSGSSSARQSIDPAEVQRVFGTEATVVDLQSLGSDQIRAVQQSLQDRGHYKGPIDGVYGPQTRAGLKAMLSQQYSLNQRLINQGQITGPLASSMGIQESDMTNVGGTDPSPSGSMSPTPPASRQGAQPSGSSTGSSNTGSSSSGSTGRSGSSPSGSSSSGSMGAGSPSSPSGSSSGSGSPR